MQAMSTLQPQLQIVQRVITRAADSAGERHIAVSAQRFAKMATSGAFCLTWQAHGLSYGIPSSVVPAVASGHWFLVNLSRSVLGQANDVFSEFVTLRLSANAETLAKRLSARGREGLDDMRARLARKGPELPPDLTVIDIANDGPLDQTARAALSALNKTLPLSRSLS